MKMGYGSESSGAMVVPSTFTGWYKNTMMTSARPMAIKRSRVQTRISLRKECSGSERSTLTVTSGCVLRKLAVVWPATATEGNAEARVSGDVDVAGCFSFGVSIWATLVFIAWPSRGAPDAIWQRSLHWAKVVAPLHILRFAEHDHRCKAIVATYRNPGSIQAAVRVDYSPSRA